MRPASDLPCTGRVSCPPFSCSPPVPLWLQHRLPEAWEMHISCSAAAACCIHSPLSTTRTPSLWLQHRLPEPQDVHISRNAALVVEAAEVTLHKLELAGALVIEAK